MQPFVTHTAASQNWVLHYCSILITTVLTKVTFEVSFTLLVVGLMPVSDWSFSLHVIACHVLLVCSLLLLLLLTSLHVIQVFSHMRLQVHGNVCFFLKSMWAAKPWECYVTKLLLSGRSGATKPFHCLFLWFASFVSFSVTFFSRRFCLSCGGLHMLMQCFPFDLGLDTQKHCVELLTRVQS